jgi:hypothetical protein
VAVNVLHHHDRIVDHKAHGDDDRHQGQVVQAEAHHVHQGETGDQRHPSTLDTIMVADSWRRNSAITATTSRTRSAG